MSLFFGGDVPPPSPPVAWWYSLFLALTTPTALTYLIIATALVFAGWYALSSWYDQHAVLVDVGETVGPFAYGVEKRRSSHARKRRR